MFECSIGDFMSPRYPAPYLIDAPEEGIVEEHGHLPLTAAATAEDAAREFARVYESVDYDNETPIFSCDGTTVWLRPIVYEYDSSEARVPTQAELEDPEFCFDCVRFTKAEPGEPLALEWWVIEAIPRCDRYDEEGDFYCLLADGHDGPHSEEAPATLPAPVGVESLPPEAK